MPAVSASKAARQAKKAEAAAAKKSKAGSGPATADASKANSENGDTLEDADEPSAKISAKVEKLKLQEGSDGISDRVTTGVLASQESSRDVKIISASLVFHGKVLIQDSTIEVSYGRRYGLLGENGCGKSTFLKAIDKREYPFPEAIDIYLLNEGAPPTDDGALEWVVKQAENKLKDMEQQAETILEERGPEDPALEEIYEVSIVLDHIQRHR